MSAENIFQLCSTLALAGWILIILSNWFSTEKWVIGIIVTVLAAVYTFLVFAYFRPADAGSFSTLEGVMALFTREKLVLAGWVHYLAFDLMTGVFIAGNARKHNISFWAVLPCLFFTFMLGPFGLLLYFIIRFAKTKQFFIHN